MGKRHTGRHTSYGIIVKCITYAGYIETENNFLLTFHITTQATAKTKSNTCARNR